MRETLVQQHAQNGAAVALITVDRLADIASVRHGFFTREGGTSEGLYASLNCGPGSGDAPERVAANRAHAMAALGLPAEALVTLYQVHSNTVVLGEDTHGAGRPPKADALVTARAGIALGVLSADCAPVLFADPEAGVIGAAHAGWRGALAGVLEATVERMLELGATRASIRAALGPCIAQPSYEVGAEFPGPFLAEDAASAEHFAPAERRGHWLFDLPGYVMHRLAGLGLAEAHRTGDDTAADPARFFSYRRACQTGESDYGRLLSTIALIPG